MKILRQSLMYFMAVILILALTGCMPALSTVATTTEPSPTDCRIIWTGTILEIDAGGKAFLASVDEDYQKLLGDKAHVDLYEGADVVLDKTDEPIELSAVPVGSWVKVTIVGGIRESYPVQVSAVEVRVISEGVQRIIS